MSWPEQWAASDARQAALQRPASHSRPAPPPPSRDTRGFSRSPGVTSRWGTGQWARRPAAPGNSAAPPPPAARPARPGAPRSPGRRAHCPACGPSPCAARLTRDRLPECAARLPGLPACVLRSGPISGLSVHTGWAMPSRRVVRPPAAPELGALGKRSRRSGEESGAGLEMWGVLGGVPSNLGVPTRA